MVNTLLNSAERPKTTKKRINLKYCEKVRTQKNCCFLFKKINRKSGGERQNCSKIKTFRSNLIRCALFHTYAKQYIRKCLQSPEPAKKLHPNYLHPKINRGKKFVAFFLDGFSRCASTEKYTGYNDGCGYNIAASSSMRLALNFV